MDEHFKVGAAGFDVKNEAYYLHPGPDGTILGHGYTPDGTIPEGYIVCSREQFVRWDLHRHDGKGNLLAPTPEQVAAHTAKWERILTAKALRENGLQVRSKSDPDFAATYAVEGVATQAAQLEGYIARRNSFPGTSGTFPWRDIAGKTHVFRSVAQFLAFVDGVSDFMADLDAYTKGLGDAPHPVLIIE